MALLALTDKQFFVVGGVAVVGGLILAYQAKKLADTVVDGVGDLIPDALKPEKVAVHPTWWNDQIAPHIVWDSKNKMLSGSTSENHDLPYGAVIDEY